MNRRQFLKGGVSITAGLVAAGCTNRKEGQAGELSRKSRREKSVVAVARDPLLEKNPDNTDRYASLLDRALALAAGTKSAREAMKRWFRPDDVVGVKLNCLAGLPLSPKKQLCERLVELLAECGIGPEKVVFFERAERDLRKAGFTPRYSGGPLYLGHDSPTAGYENRLMISGQVGTMLSKVVTRRITALVSFGVLKDHNLAGVGGAMKNLFGIIHNPNKFHDNNCDPYVADVWEFPDVKRKFRLAILDGIVAQAHGGPAFLPGYAWNCGAVLVSTDPVAIDTVAKSMLDEKRTDLGLPSLEKEKRPPRYLHTAAARGLGHDSLDKVVIAKG